MFPADALEALDRLRDLGYAVTIFTPEELLGCDPSSVEDIMMERAQVYIDDMKLE